MIDNNDFLQLTLDPNLQVKAWKGELFQRNGFAGKVKVGAKIQDVLDSLWNLDIMRCCEEVLTRGEKTSVILDKTFPDHKVSFLFIGTPTIYRKKVSGLTLSIYDITSSRRLEREQAVKDRMDHIGQLASQVVHKMNNPLAIVLNRIGSLLVDDITKKSPEFLRKELENMQEQIYSMSMITNALSAFDKEPRNRFRLVDVNDILGKSLELIKLLHLKGTIEYDLQLADELPRVLGSEVTLEQSFLNVLQNATEAMPDGGTLTVKTFVDPLSPRFIEIQISDTGPGLSEDMADNVFDPFFTTKNSNHSGLGLAVSYAIITNHNGSIDLDSTEKRGTTVFIHLPIASI